MKIVSCSNHKHKTKYDFLPAFYLGKINKYGKRRVYNNYRDARDNNNESFSTVEIIHRLNPI